MMFDMDRAKITSIVDVRIGGQTSTTGYTFDSNTNIFTFNSVANAPDYGGTGLIRYRYSVGKKMTYPFNAGDHIADSVSLFGCLVVTIAFPTWRLPVTMIMTREKSP